MDSYGLKPTQTYDLFLLDGPTQQSRSQPIAPTNVRAVAVHVRAKKLEPLYAAIPASLPYWLIASVALTISADAIAEAIPKARKASYIGY